MMFACFIWMILCPSATTSPPQPSAALAQQHVEPSDYVRRAWDDAGRRWLTRYTGVAWNNDSQRWSLQTNWSHASTDAAQQAYYAEYALRPALNFAIASRDTSLISELADFYVAFLPRFTTLGALRQRASLTVSTRLLDGQGRDDQRTLVWLEKSKVRSRLIECELCNAQFLHPAAKLMRAIALLPAAQRSKRDLRFIEEYRSLLIDEHLIRLGFNAEPNDWGLTNLPRTRVDSWRQYARGFQTPKHFQSGMTDRDLWLVAAAAEVLGANTADPGLIRLGDKASLLRDLVAAGVAFFRTSRTEYRDTRNFEGRVVRSASYFNGNYADHPQMAYSGYRGATFPSPSDAAIQADASWDISHAYRIPVFFRSLADTKGSNGTDFPSDEEMTLVINQYNYRVFNRDFERPLFHNFFDGSDGWFRVNYLGRSGTGYPPSAFCDARLASRPCLSRGAVMGWGLISAWSSDLQRVLCSVTSLADDRDSSHAEFRDRYYVLNGEKFVRLTPTGDEQHPFLLFGLLAEMKGAATSGCPDVH